MSKRDVHCEVVSVVSDSVRYATVAVLRDVCCLSGRSADIAADAAVHALSGKAMSARDVWERMAAVCVSRRPYIVQFGCSLQGNYGGPCHMAHCPRLR